MYFNIRNSEIPLTDPLRQAEIRCCRTQDRQRGKDYKKGIVWRQRGYDAQERKLLDLEDEVATLRFHLLPLF